MTKPIDSPIDSVSRRSFIKGSAAGLGVITLPSTLPAVHIGGREEPIKFCVIGCGGRGTGAANQILNSPHPTQLVAMADAFSDRMSGSYKAIKKRHGDKVAVTPETMFTGFDAFQKAIDCGVDLVVLATPPGFRPIHLAYAVDKKKHVFMEKPVAVDGTGVRSVLESTAKAKAQNTALAVGLQRRHEPQYIETIKRLQDGAIGDIMYSRVFWNGGGVWTRARKPGQTEMEYQMRNWYYFNWLCGDHITEQHIHNLDVGNWLMGDFPIKANAQGGRQVRTGLDNGEIFDHFFVEYEYANGARMYSQCRHIRGCFNSVSEHAYGTKGSSNMSGSQISPNSGERWRFDRKKRKAGHQQEQLDLIDAIARGEIYNEGEYGAKSTMTSILGRHAAYSGKWVTFEDSLNSTMQLMPNGELNWNSKPPTTPDENGRYPIPVPGKTKVISKPKPQKRGEK